MPARTWKNPSLERSPGEELPVARVVIREQEVRRIRIGAGDDDGGYVHDVGRQPGRDELVDRLGRGHQHLAAQVSAFLG